MLSIIIPVYNEADSLRELHAEIDRVCQAQNIAAEIVFVDDGSSDTSWDVIEQLTKSDARVSGIRFRRNFGKSAALSAGMLAARGELILMMDADLQDDPAEIPAFLRKIDEGFDVINGWKRRRLDPWHKVYPSRVFNFFVSQLTGLWLHDHNCGLKCFRKQVAAEIRLYGELHRFVPVLAHARGFKVTELEINHRQRRFGHSKYGIRRFVRGFLDLLTVKFLTGFGQRPQHMLGAIGLIFFALGSLGLSYLAVVWLLTNIAGFDFARIGDRPALAYSIASLLLGSQMISLGFLAELIVAYTGRDSDTYSVVSRIGPTSNEPKP
ncbi:MAG: glycosyltransferase family 2 protein [Planctomycetales bacterium]|nr:glycosyltransferase family 2 protein [Planctomycetales bacterium]